MFSCLQILEAFLWFVLITLLNVTLIILTLSVSRLLNLLLRLVAFLLFLNPQCLASISRSEERFSRNAETDLVCRLLLEKKKGTVSPSRPGQNSPATHTPSRYRRSLPQRLADPTT